MARNYETVWEQFRSTEVAPQHLIRIVFRMPNTQRVEQQFDRNDSIEKMYQFVSVCPTSGMKVGSTEFEITQTFPRTVLNPASKIQDVFGTSDAEMVNVFELN